MQVSLQYEADDCAQDSESISTSFQFYLPSVFVANHRKMLQSEAILRWESTKNLERGTNPRWDLFLTEVQSRSCPSPTCFSELSRFCLRFISRRVNLHLKK